ncbi:MAG: hypothetical protein ABIH21_02755 [Patescibacteria group bacterium]
MAVYLIIVILARVCVKKEYLILSIQYLAKGMEANFFVFDCRYLILYTGY